MHLIKSLLMIFIIFICVVINDLVQYNYSEKENDIKEIASKMESIVPAFSFISDDYKEFAYDN